MPTRSARRRWPRNVFWKVYEHWGNLSPRFLSGKAGKRFACKFKRTIHLVDSTTIALIASCMDWAKHRRRKAAAQCHWRLDLQSFLPRFAIVDTARHPTSTRVKRSQKVLTLFLELISNFRGNSRVLP